MSTKFKNILKNKNLHFYWDKDNLYVEFIPYNNDLSSIDYTKRWLENIKQVEKEIMGYFGIDYFAINLGSYNLDGLTETSNTLIFNNSVLFYNYCHEYRCIKI